MASQDNLSSIKISLDLIKNLSEFNPNESQKKISDYLLKNGVSTSLKSKDDLNLYLYFHAMCVPFLQILSQIKSDEINKIFISCLKENIQLLCDQKINHLNYEKISEEIFDKIEVKETDSNLSVGLAGESETSTSKIELNKILLELGLNSHGRLDIYVKSHIIKNLILFSGIEEISAYAKKFQTMEDELTKIYQTAKSNPFNEKKYLEMVELFVNGQKKEEYQKTVKNLKKDIILFQTINDKVSLKNLERLFIQLLGHMENEIRNQSVIALNMIYDETNWQEKNAFLVENTKIKLLDDELTLVLKININDYSEGDLVLITNSPCENLNVDYNVISFIKAKEETTEEKFVKLVFPFGKIKKCGFYDWYLAKFKDGGYTNIKIISDKDEVREGKGRFIILNQDIKDLSVHEVFCDLIKAQIDKDHGVITQRGSFKTLEEKLDEYSQRYINCLYIMGALERDNDISYDEETAEPIDIANKESSPMAITNRTKISSLLGGDKAFKSLMMKCKKLSIKVILDSLSRVSSSRANRKYRDVLLRYMDNKGKIQICYGTDGQSVQYDDSTVLNYRKIEAWEMLINEILILIGKYKIDGIHLDNCQAWPQIMAINAIEMYRIDDDGQPSYTAMEILNGEIVSPLEESGYWGTEASESYANPMLVKLTKTIWNVFPNFVFFGECWLNEKFSNNRHVNLSKSGIIPRMYTLPIIICNILGKKISRNGYIEKTNPGNVKLLRDWFTQNYAELPDGALLVQSSTGQIWPYPALLYGRGNWCAVDLLFSLPDIPMTFMDEIDGEAYRVQIINVYNSQDKTGSSSSNLLNKDNKKTRSKSLMKLIESKEQEAREKASRLEKEKSLSTTSTSTLAEYLPSYDISENLSTLISLSGINVSNIREKENKQQQVVRELGPESGFDLNKIKLHYNHRRKLRYSHECLRRGKIIYLKALLPGGNEHPGVFAFARQSDEETGIFAINFTGDETNFELDLSNLLEDENNNFNSICYIEDWLSDEKGDIYFTRELMEGHTTRKIEPYHTLCFGFCIIPCTKENYKNAMEKSNARMIAEVKKNNGNADSFQTTLQLKEILNKDLPLDEFAKWVACTDNLLKTYNISFYEYVRKLGFIWWDERLCTKFFIYCARMSKIKSYLSNPKIAEMAENITNSNVLGPICFVTPELGRWSTVGGLGVMVDELSQGLSTIGQEVIMISPYYDRNRKGQQNYLENDPFNIKYLRNIEVSLDGQYTFGVHAGEGNGGIKYYFLHNFKIFPRPYPDFTASETVREISLFAKGCLQLLCDLGKIPALIITNDWFTGLTAGYAKCKHFGDTFNGTIFFHICHNLEPTYEGRIYPSPQEGALEGIHQLPRDCLVDPWWKQTVINPSRCAIMMSDQWGTVSNSYKQDLQNSSPLASLLNQKPQPFSYPNGIFRVRRLKALQEKAGTDRLECKRYIQKTYFGYGDVDPNVPIYSFVGRLTQQKGVLMILDSVEEVIRITGGKVNILVGGMGDPRDPYCAACINKINYLRGKYSYAFWANPQEFFVDGPKVNFGSDFGLMPSLFEPGGIVQHEFFIAGTPVIAFRTGGLKDTVFEFQWDNNSGNGFTFDYYTPGDLINAIDRSLHLFRNKEKFEICRKNAFNSAIDVADVSRAWCKEFYRLKGKIFFNTKEVLDNAEIKDKSEIEKTVNILNNLNENDMKNYVFKKEETEQFASHQQANKKLPKINFAPQSVIIDGEMRFPVSFSYGVDSSQNVSSVQVCGSFDKWQVRHPLTYDPIKSQWNLTLKVKKGKYFYKYIVDGEWVVNNNEPTETEESGIVNNVVNL